MGSSLSKHILDKDNVIYKVFNDVFHWLVAVFCIDGDYYPYPVDPCYLLSDLPQFGEHS